MVQLIFFQIELVHAQFKRAKERTDAPDSQLEIDLAMVEKEKDPDHAILKRLSETLHLRTVNDLKRESLAIHDMVILSSAVSDDCFETMSCILKKLKDCIVMGNPEASDMSEGEKGLIRHRSPVIPDDFRCPISLELMKDPVIVSTGQVKNRHRHPQLLLLYVNAFLCC